jgi:hypothetical protein
MRSWRIVPIVATSEYGRPNLPLRLLLRPTQQDSATAADFSTDPARPKQAHNYKLNGDTEAGQQKDADEVGTMGESECLQPPASSRGVDCADQLLAYGPDHECGANAYRAARIANRGYGNEQACNDDRHCDPCGAKGQTSENRHDLDNGRKDHGERGLVGETSLGAYRAVTDRRERAFDDVRRAQMLSSAQPRRRRTARRGPWSGSRPPWRT